MLVASVHSADDHPGALELRVGLVAWDESIPRGESNALQKNDFRPLYALREARGTYAEVLHWLRKGLVDVALLTPGPYAELLDSEAGLPADRRCTALAYSDVYLSTRTRCVVRKASAFKSMTDIRSAVKQNAAKFIFVDPLSTTGRIIPQHAIQSDGTVVPPDAIRYSYSHANALELLAQSDEQTIAFVSNGVAIPQSLEESLRTVELPELKEYKTPVDVWVARAGTKYAANIQLDLLNRRLATRPADVNPIPFEDISIWMRDLKIKSSAAVSSQDILGQLRHYARTHGSPPRVALVLSGGGAKCSYQVGATAALEEAFAKARASDPTLEWLDFHLVAGTSGGAINALPAAMKLTATPEGRTAFGGVWRSLDLKQMVRPSLAVCAVIGLWLANLFVLLGLFGARLAQIRKETPRPWWATPALVLCAVVFAFVLSLSLAPTPIFGHNRELRFLGLYWSFGLLFMLLFLPPLLVAVWWVKTRTKFARTRIIAGALAVLLLVVSPVLTAVMMLHSDRTLFYGAGIERVLADGFETLTRTAYPALPPESGTPAERLQSLSRTIIDKRLIERDLVITGNCLPPVTPADRYFYCLGSKRATNAPLPTFGGNGVDLKAYPSHLLDTVMGSGTIFPVFPPRELHDFPAKGQAAELIDGGFAHNSPIEAALWWGATHVILIEATPAAPAAGSRVDFLSNAQDAFEYLYQQTQLADARSRERISIFTLRPAPPHMMLLDFAPAPIDASMARGYGDAGGARFERTEGQPRFK